VQLYLINQEEQLWDFLQQLALLLVDTVLLNPYHVLAFQSMAVNRLFFWGIETTLDHIITFLMYYFNRYHHIFSTYCSGMNAVYTHLVLCVAP
jgi:hypothetical protein